MPQVAVRKLDHDGQQVLAYPGQVIRRERGAIVLRTAWNREPLAELQTMVAQRTIPFSWTDDDG